MNRTIKRLICGVSICLSLHANAVDGLRPENFLLGDVLFQRPTSWVWVPVEETKPAHKFIIPDENGNESGSVIMFFHPKQNGTNTTTADTIIPRWREQFSPQTFFDRRETKVGNNLVTYMRVEGTQRSSATRAERRPDFALCAAVAEISKGTITVRVVGPKSIMDNAAKDLQKLIEDGLKTN